MSKKPTRLGPGERLTPKRWAAAVEALEAKAEQAEAKFPGDTREARLRRKAEAILFPERFNQVYLPHWFRSVSAAFHLELYRALETEKRLAVRAPRGHAKSTVVTFAFVLHQVVCGAALRGLDDGTLYQSDPDLAAAVDRVSQESSHAPVTNWDPYIQVISSSQDLANEFVEAIALEIQENERLKADWGETWRPGEPSLYDWVSATDVRVRAFGMEGDIRGGKHRQYRPTLAVFDDPDSERTIATRKVRDRQERKLTAAVNYGLEPERGRVMVIGTPLHSDCLVCRLTDPRRYERWSKLRYKAIQDDGTPLWPARWSLAALQVEEQEDPEAFGSEMMDRPPTEGNKPFPALHYYDRAVYAAQDLPRILIFDPALGKTEHSDYQAIVELRGPTADGKVLVDRCELLRVANPGELVATVNGIIAEDKPAVRIIEAIGFQVLLTYMLTDAASQAGLVDVGWVQIEHQGQSKDVRIRGMAPGVARGDILFPDDRSCRPLETQFLDYPDGKKDGVDATEMGIRFIRQGGSDFGWT
jgi:hypothetical protein